MMQGRGSRPNLLLLCPIRPVAWLAAWLALTPLALSTPAAADARDADHQTLITRALADLAAANPDAREHAHQTLLSLKRNDLATLRSIVQQRLPLSPAEAEPLRDIVTHVYLSDESYASDSTIGFVGVVFDPDQKAADPELGGVEIRRRIPGFCGYRSLEDGDVVLSIGLTPHALRDLQSYEDMTTEIRHYPAGQTVLFRLLRRGRVVIVPLLLDARPTRVSVEITITDFQAQRNAQAEGYWDQFFEPLLQATAQASP